MRLLNTRTFELESFPRKSDRPPYIIASHRWYDEELETSHEDVREKKNTESAGYVKVLEFCDYITECHGDVQYLWIDTCCIDKKNAPELQEAITSMFTWYQEAYCCLAYLHDVATNDVSADDADFHLSEWFKRGWTLQELLAPSTVIMLNRDWFALGYKGYRLRNAPNSIEDLTPILAQITSIPQIVLYDSDVSKNIDVVSRLAWMKDRQTTRAEDMAYALLGVFDISMTLRYGEGGKALERLKAKVITNENARHSSLKARDEREALAANLHRIINLLLAWQGDDAPPALLSSPATSASRELDEVGDDVHETQVVGHHAHFGRDVSLGIGDQFLKTSDAIEAELRTPELLQDSERSDSKLNEAQQSDRINSTKGHYLRDGLRMMTWTKSIPEVRFELAVGPSESIIDPELHKLGIRAWGRLLPKEVCETDDTYEYTRLDSSDRRNGTLIQVLWPFAGEPVSVPSPKGDKPRGVHACMFLVCKTRNQWWIAAPVILPPFDSETPLETSTKEVVTLYSDSDPNQQLKLLDTALGTPIVVSSYRRGQGKMVMNLRTLYTFDPGVAVKEVGYVRTDCRDYLLDRLFEAWDVSELNRELFEDKDSVTEKHGS